MASSSSSSSATPPTKLPDIGKSIATALQVIPVLRGSNFDSWKARYGDVANMLKWHAELLDLDPNAGPYDFDHETELQERNRSIAWQVIVKTLAEQSDIIEGQETEGKRNARDAYRAVVAEYDSQTTSNTTDTIARLMKLKMSDVIPPQIRPFAAKLMKMAKTIQGQGGAATPDHFLLTIFLAGLPSQHYATLTTSVSMEPNMTFALAVTKARAFAVHKGLERTRGDADLPPAEHRRKQEVYLTDQEAFNEMFKIAAEANSKTDWRASVECHSCGKRGHIMKDCKFRTGPKRPCRNFLRGRCNYGSKCRFEHVKAGNKNKANGNDDAREKTQRGGRRAHFDGSTLHA